MKKLILLAALVFTVSFTQGHAAPKEHTLESFLKMHQEKAEKNGKKFYKKGKVKLFKELDANSDGKVTRQESKVYWAAKKKSKNNK